MPKSKTYEEFVEKFKPKKTTDDCYTPELVYNAIRDWVCKEYGIDPAQIVRPFWPGADFQLYGYPPDCVVLDNPPFSILSEIIKWYTFNGIKFFLFAPSLTCLSGKDTVLKVNHLICDTAIVYENGAEVRTSFVTNLGEDGIVMQTAPELSEIVNVANDENQRAKKGPPLPKYSYPDNIATAAMFQRYAKYGIDIKIRREDCVRVGKIDSQAATGKAIFGGGLLLSSRAAAERAAAERAAAERAAAERAAAHRWELSDREREIVRMLDEKGARADADKKSM